MADSFDLIGGQWQNQILGVNDEVIISQCMIFCERNFHGDSLVNFEAGAKKET
jgi:hypothetical protein